MVLAVEDPVEDPVEVTMVGMDSTLPPLNRIRRNRVLLRTALIRMLSVSVLLISHAPFV